MTRLEDQFLSADAHLQVVLSGMRVPLRTVPREPVEFPPPMTLCSRSPDKMPLACLHRLAIQIVLSAPAGALALRVGACERDCCLCSRHVARIPNLLLSETAMRTGRFDHFVRRPHQ
jgi:hypothetical protein